MRKIKEVLRLLGWKGVLSLVLLAALSSLLTVAAVSVGAWLWLNLIAGFGFSFWQIVGLAGFVAGCIETVKS